MSEDINIEVKMVMKMRKYLPPDAKNGKSMIPMKNSTTLLDLKNQLGIPVNEFSGIVLDGKNNEIEDTYMLKNGDTISFLATVAGG